MRAMECVGSFNKGNKPFRYLASWLTHDSFADLVKDNWKDINDWNGNIDTFTRVVKEWNKNVFGNISLRKNRLLDRLHGIARSLENGFNPYLQNLQKKLWSEYEQVLYQEEVLWYQKSRCKWLQYGDRNTKYFHGATVFRRKKQRVEALQDNLGNWIADPATLKRMASSYFCSLYTDDTSYIPFGVAGAFQSLSKEELSSIYLLVNSIDVRNALFDMGGMKAPGSDGYRAIFFQSQWETVGDSIIRLVADIFRHPHKISQLNETLICLIPKVENPANLKQFRPISLCNVTYKIITKIVAKRMRGVMSKLVAPMQCSFVPGGHSSDNIVIAQEVIHTMKKKTGVKGIMAIKIDLEKAYCSISGCFMG